MEKEIFTRYITYLLSFQSYQIVSVLRNKYGNDKVDSTVYYDNFKKYIKSILLEAKATWLFDYMKSYVIKDAPNAIQRYYTDLPSVEIIVFTLCPVASIAPVSCTAICPVSAAITD